ncbi:MAG: energy-coupling factor ABC transporter permease, partial [Acidimicrobiales bacterium]
IGTDSSAAAPASHTVAVRRLLPRRLGDRDTATVWLAGAAALLSVPMAAAAFTLEFAIGGNADISIGTVAGAMVGTHLLIGIGEGLITAAAVGAVLASRRDLVHAVDTVDRPLELRPREVLA